MFFSGVGATCQFQGHSTTQGWLSHSLSLSLSTTEIMHSSLRITLYCCNISVCDFCFNLVFFLLFFDRQIVCFNLTSSSILGTLCWRDMKSVEVTSVISCYGWVVVVRCWAKRCMPTWHKAVLSVAVLPHQWTAHVIRLQMATMKIPVCVWFCIIEVL